MRPICPETDVFRDDFAKGEERGSRRVRRRGDRSRNPKKTDFWTCLTVAKLFLDHRIASRVLMKLKSQKLFLQVMGKSRSLGLVFGR